MQKYFELDFMACPQMLGHSSLAQALAWRCVCTAHAQMKAFLAHAQLLLCCGVRDPALEEDHPGQPVAQEEQERMVQPDLW